MKLACSDFEMESVWFRSHAHGGTVTVLPTSGVATRRIIIVQPGGTSFTGHFCCSPGRNGSQLYYSCGILVWGDFVALNLESRCMKLPFAYFLHSSVQYSLFFQHLVYMLSNRPQFEHCVCWKQWSASRNFALRTLSKGVTIHKGGNFLCLWSRPDEGQPDFSEHSPNSATQMPFWSREGTVIQLTASEELRSLSVPLVTSAKLKWSAVSWVRPGFSATKTTAIYSVWLIYYIHRGNKRASLSASDVGHYVIITKLLDFIFNIS